MLETLLYTKIYRYLTEHVKRHHSLNALLVVVLRVVLNTH